MQFKQAPCELRLMLDGSALHHSCRTYALSAIKAEGSGGSRLLETASMPVIE
jgi:hypothetical protein